MKMLAILLFALVFSVSAYAQSTFSVNTSTGNVGIGTSLPANGTALDLSRNTNSMLLPVGTTGDRPTGINGMLRYNSTANAVESFSNGSWTSASAGAMVLLASATASNSAEVAFTNIPSGYDQYVLNFTNVVPATNGTIFKLQFSEDNGSTYISSGYVTTSWSFTSSNISGQNATTTYFPLHSITPIPNTAGKGITGKMTFGSLGSSSLYKIMNYEAGGIYSGDGSMASATGSGIYATDTNVVNAIRVIATTGNVSSGKFSLYGIQN
jgi:hypothetical protein